MVMHFVTFIDFVCHNIRSQRIEFFFSNTLIFLDFGLALGSPEYLMPLGITYTGEYALISNGCDLKHLLWYFKC